MIADIWQISKDLTLYFGFTKADVQVMLHLRPRFGFQAFNLKFPFYYYSIFYLFYFELCNVHAFRHIVRIHFHNRQALIHSLIMLHSIENPPSRVPDYQCWPDFRLARYLFLKSP